ncbi:ABC transporter ATP-binding protein [Mesorhizobium sp. ASY16-5R]|uniref:ABC transporter ATP-binding protein n=1 Tax=Mesorhizobium sp. ASY16-5R TaxID=3445772 RepID=UPI003FA05427
MTTIRAERLSRSYGEIVAVDGVTLDFPAGSFTALLGPSGCGKTTLLRLIAGFEAPAEGQILFDDRLIADPLRQIPPESRGVGIVFQSYALWPHMDVAENVAYPLKTRRTAKVEIERKVADVLEIVGLAGFQARRIDELSGGQRQRVALARCLVADAKVILFDEPLANLDMHLRAAMVDVFRDIHRRTGATIVYVTHDQAEALALADRVAVLSRGRLLQVAPPRDVYRAPADATVAGFVGRGAIISGSVVAATGDMSTVEAAGHRFFARGGGKPGPARILLRPEALRLAADGFAARVLDSVYRGPVHEVRLALATGEEVVLDSIDAPAAGAVVHIACSDAWVIPTD